MSSFVLDASLAMSWCFAGEGGQYSEKVLTSLDENSAVVPTLWIFEITNVLVVAERKARLSAIDGNRFLSLIFQLPIEINTSLPIATELLRISRDFKLTSYDSAYLDLAIRLGHPIATLDQDLKKAARKMGIPLYLS